MKFKPLLNGENIPTIGLGTWRMGGSMSPDYSHDRQVVDQLHEAIRLGYTHIDTAEMYGGGHTEELIGRAIQIFDRERLQITSKVWHTNLSYQEVLDALDGSLKRLHTSYVDFYLIHWPSERVALEETLQAMNELVRQEKVRHLGVSNFNLEQLKQAQDLSEAPIMVNQVPYSLYNRTYAKNGVLDYCQKNGIVFTAHSPFDRGTALSNPVVRQISQRHEATSGQIALAWLVNQPGVVTIPMSRDPGHLKENLLAADIELSRQDLEQLNQLEMPDESLWPE